VLADEIGRGRRRHIHTLVDRFGNLDGREILKVGSFHLAEHHRVGDDARRLSLQSVRVLVAES